MNAVLQITGLSRTTIYRRIAGGLFPPPVHLGGRACGWRTTALRAWIENPEQYRAARLEDEKSSAPKIK
ncbi:helix-turn-helix transcriptional regulator [Variovorax sp. RB2P76]|jgi:predicted DNA-binding transcriptional regulator AlpA|uniref:helix-turn-helix transcriptional regulator n=1 Tax=Variovorax sp. RB2P76 TaxID=3443736 RepID=UPI003F4845D5